jgi:hypothetical protein
LSLAIDGADARYFDSTSSWIVKAEGLFKYGSVPAMADLLLSSIGAALAFFMGLILVLIGVQKVKIDAEISSIFVWLLFLWSFIFPTRAYSIWYQNFSSYETGYADIPVVVIVAYALASLLIFAYVFKEVKKLVAFVLLTAFPFVTVILKASSNVIDTISIGLNTHIWVIFMIMLILVLVMIGILGFYSTGNLLKDLLFKKETAP